MIREDRNHYRLSSGRKFYANCGILGLSPDNLDSGEYQDLPYGYDGTVTLRMDWADDFVPWSVEERQELADYMIALWMQWKTRQVTENTAQKKV